MIYGNMILEDHLEKLIDPATIIQEYYENEISILNTIIEYQDKSFITESYELEALREGFVENVKSTVKKIIENFINFLKKISNAIKGKDRSTKKTEEELEKIIKELDETTKSEYEIKYLSSELEDVTISYTTEINGKVSSIISAVEDLIISITNKDDDYIDRIIDIINDEMKEQIPSINFSKYIVTGKANIKEIKKAFTGVHIFMNKERINVLLSLNDERIDKCKKLLSNLDKISNNNEIDKTRVTKVMKSINNSIAYLQKLSSELLKTYNEYKNINNKLMTEALNKIKKD